MKKIYLASPKMSEEKYEEKYVKEAFDTNWLSTVGENINKFEEAVKDYMGVENAVALASRFCCYTFRTKNFRCKKGRFCICIRLNIFC